MTCDKYSDLWTNNLQLFDKYWNDRPNTHLVSDKPNDLINSFNCFFHNFNGDFSFRLLNILNKVENEYIFLTLDDYLLHDFVNTKVITDLVNEMTEKKISYIRLFKRKKIHGGWLNSKMRIHLLPLKSETYEVNLYPSIWRRIDLINLIKSDENIWKFEVRLTRRCREKKYVCGWINNKKCFRFVDTIRKGKYLRKAYRFLKKENLYVSERPVRTIGETIKLNIRTVISRFSPDFIKKKLKRLTRKEYFSDYANNDD